MNFKSSIDFIAEHYIVVAGSTLALFFATSMVLLIRSIGKKDEAQGGSTSLDVKDIETVMQRVLAAQPQVAVPAPVAPHASEAPPQPAAPAVSNEAVVELKKTISDFESRVAQLTNELAEAKSAAAAAPPPAEAPSEDVGPLKEKLSELEARLSEYEIIEDDIADLSHFKDENTRLKEEIAKLKGADPTASIGLESGPSSTGGSETPPPEVSQEALASSGQVKKPDRFEVDISDEVMKEFATAVEIKNAPEPETAASVPPVEAVDAAKAIEDLLAETPDTEKMLNEVSSLESEGEALGDVLSEALDADKLLAEVSSLTADPSSAAEAEENPAKQFKKAQGS